MAEYARPPFEIEIHRPGKTYRFTPSDMVNLEKYPEVRAAIEKVRRRQKSPTNKMVSNVEEK